MTTFKLATIGFALAILVPLAGLIVCLITLQRIDRRRAHVVRLDRGEGLAEAGVAIAGLLTLVGFGALVSYVA